MMSRWMMLLMLLAAIVCGSARYPSFGYADEDDSEVSDTMTAELAESSSEDYCDVPGIGRVPVWHTWNGRRGCLQGKCLPGGVTTYATCGWPQIPPGCTLQGNDLAPFPNCCPVPHCPADELEGSFLAAD